MPRSFVYVLLIILGLTIGGVVWYFQKAAAKARSPVLGANQAKPTQALHIWAYGDAATVELYRQKIEEMQGVITSKMQLRVFPTRRDILLALHDGITKQKLPDVFLAELPDFTPFYSAKLLKPLPLKDHPAFEWIPDIFNAFIRNDCLMAFPSEYNLYVLYYNRRHFDRVGIAYPDTHWNWQTLVDVSRAVYRAPDHPKGQVYALEYMPTLEMWNALAAQADEGLYRGWDWLWTVPEATASIHEALKFMVDLHTQYTFCAPAFVGNMPPHFIAGASAMTIAGSGLRFKLQEDPEFQWGVTMLPRKNKYATPLQARGWAVTASSKAPNDAVIVAHTLSHFVAPGWMTARASQREDMTQDYTTVFQVSLRYGKPPYSHPDNERARQIVNAHLARLFEPGPKTAEEIIAGLEPDLAPLNLPGPQKLTAESMGLLKK